MTWNKVLDTERYLILDRDLNMLQARRRRNESPACFDTGHWLFICTQLNRLHSFSQSEPCKRQFGFGTLASRVLDRSAAADQLRRFDTAA